MPPLGSETSAETNESSATFSVDVFGETDMTDGCEPATTWAGGVEPAAATAAGESDVESTTRASSGSTSGIGVSRAGPPRRAVTSLTKLGPPSFARRRGWDPPNVLIHQPRAPARPLAAQPCAPLPIRIVRQI